jgi:hypothetical protein
MGGRRPTVPPKIPMLPSDSPGVGLGVYSDTLAHTSVV